MIQYVTGDATTPIGSGCKIIAHITNNQGGWGGDSGFVRALSRKWKMPEQVYRYNEIDHVLGCNQYVEVEPDLWVANMCAQDGYRSQKKPVAVNYYALAVCLEKLSARALAYRASVHCPRIGCGLGGGDWPTVAEILERVLVANGVPVTVYDF